MLPADFAGPTNRLLIHEKRGEHDPEIGQPKSETLVEPGPNGAATHFIERVAIPPAVHVRFAKTERAGRRDAPKKAAALTLCVPRRPQCPQSGADRGGHAGLWTYMISADAPSAPLVY